MRDVRRKAARPANVSPAGRDSGRLRTSSPGKAGVAAFRRLVSGHAEHLAALGFFAAMCVVVLSVPARPIEPDDLAYRLRSTPCARATWCCPTLSTRR